MRCSSFPVGVDEVDEEDNKTLTADIGTHASTRVGGLFGNSSSLDVGDAAERLSHHDISISGCQIAHLDGVFRQFQNRKQHPQT